MANGTIMNTQKESTDVISNTTYMSGTWRLIKVGRVVTLQIAVFKGIPSGSFSLGTVIPDGYRPLYEQAFTILKRSNPTGVMAFSVTTAGAVNCYNYSSAQTGEAAWNNVITWLCA